MLLMFLNSWHRRGSHDAREDQCLENKRLWTTKSLCRRSMVNAFFKSFCCKVHTEMNPVARLFFERKNDANEGHSWEKKRLTNRSRKAPRHPIPSTSRSKVNTPKVEDALSIKFGQVVGAVLTTIKFLEKTTARLTLQIIKGFKALLPGKGWHWRTGTLRLQPSNSMTLQSWRSISGSIWGHH